MKFPDFIPNRRVRQFFVAEHIKRSGLQESLCVEIARIVPDIFLVHSGLISKEDVYLEIVDQRIFMHFGDTAYYLGDMLNGGSCSRAAAPWWDLEILGMNDQELLEVDLAQLILTFDRSKWAVEFKALDELGPGIKIHISRGLSELLGAL